jgi:hypothetical protein
MYILGISAYYRDAAACLVRDGRVVATAQELTQREMDLARSVQEVTELAMLRIARHVHKETNEKNLCLAGGVTLNCVGNGRILREGPFENVWIQPAASDAGTVLGGIAGALFFHDALSARACPSLSRPLDDARGRARLREQSHPALCGFLFNLRPLQSAGENLRTRPLESPLGRARKLLDSARDDQAIKGTVRASLLRENFQKGLIDPWAN